MKLNPYLQKRLLGTLNILRSVHTGGTALSSNNKGIEREFFINTVLSNIIAPPFRIGTGDITDACGNKSGQADIVIEYTNSISFPLISPHMPRLYLAEGVCAVIEVKSDLTKQWNEIENSYKKITELKRKYTGQISLGPSLSKQIPYFVVGYKGWNQIKTLNEKRIERNIDGIFIIEPGLYNGKNATETNEASLYAFLMDIQKLTGSMVGAMPNYADYISLD